MKKFTILFVVLLLTATVNAFALENSEIDTSNFQNEIMVKNFKNELFIAIGAVDVTRQIEKEEIQDNWIFGKVDISPSMLGHHLKSICRNDPKYEQKSAWTMTNVGDSSFIVATFLLSGMDMDSYRESGKIPDIVSVALSEEHNLVIITPMMLFEAWGLQKAYGQLEFLKEKQKELDKQDGN